jgi:hypothetical protein
MSEFPDQPSQNVATPTVTDFDVNTHFLMARPNGLFKVRARTPVAAVGSTFDEAYALGRAEYDRVTGLLRQLNIDMPEAVDVLYIALATKEAIVEATEVEAEGPAGTRVVLPSVP